jgi:hypothetical protein
LLAVLVLVDAAIAGEAPTPRQPIGPNPPTILEMLPRQSRDFGSQFPTPVPPDRIRIVNIGDQQLFVSYWDGDSTWQPVSIDSGRWTDVVCPKCAGTIRVAYHNGRKNESVNAMRGATYVLSWSAQAGVWIFTPR